MRPLKFMANFNFTSESVCAGHPDKICDRISDSIVDSVLKNDKNGRVAVEALVTYNKIVVAGEVKANTKPNYKTIVKKQIKELGYVDHKSNFSDLSQIEILVHTQSPEIAVGVDQDGAGDQGMMFGYACLDTKSLMPLPISIAHALSKNIDLARETKTLPYLKPDGKTQVTVEYRNDHPYRITNVVIAVPHQKEISLSQVKTDVYNYVIKKVLKEFGFQVKVKDVVVNGTGVWHHGGPASDTGVTGRKIIVDTYGGFSRVGGGAFSGKDATKVDRSGAYAARFLAKNIVANKLADRAEVRLAYFIGAKKPLMQEVETFGTAKKSQKVINDFMNKILDTSVSGIIKTLNLRKPIFSKTSAYGHFGRDEFPWEKITLY